MYVYGTCLLCSGRPLLNILFFSLVVLKYVVCLCMGSMSVTSCRCCMLVSCVHPVAVLNAAFGMTCILLMLVEDATAGVMAVLYVAMCLSFCLPHPVAVCFIICSGLCACTEML